MLLRIFFCLLLFLYATSTYAGDATEAPATPRVESKKLIWSEGQHNAFTSLVRRDGVWYCSFRAGLKHVGDRGKAVIIRSTDGEHWEKAAELTHELYDFRDPKLSVMPDGRLLLNGTLLDFRQPGGVRFQELRTFVSFSEDGSNWTKPKIVLDEWEWLWRFTWHKGTGYGVAYHTGLHAETPRETRHGTLYKTKDALNFEPIHRFETPDGAGETTLRFDAQDQMHLVMRRDGNERRTLLGTSQPPYKKWNLHDVDMHLGGPELIQIPSGDWVLGTRRSGGATILAKVDFEQGNITPVLNVDEEGGDRSYPGFVWHEGRLWMSFYATHGGKTGIYLAKIAFDKEN